jgi:hypothetical protein
MTKRRSALVLLALISSSVVFANTDFKILATHERVLKQQSADTAEQLMQQLNMQRHDSLTENDFFQD